MITTIDKNTALILIDLQKGILHGDKAHDLAGVLKNAATLVAAFRKAGLPIVIVHVNPIGADWLASRKDEPGMSKDAKALPPGFDEIVDDIKTEPTDIFITKKTWSAFYETPLQDELQKRGVTGIVIGGVSTSKGVEGTARAASERGYNIIFATDAMTDRSIAPHNNSVKYIFPAIGVVGSTAEIVGKMGEV